MTTRLSCPSGHSWDWAESATIPLCPVCGAAAILDPAEATASTFVPAPVPADAAPTILFPAAERTTGPETLAHGPRLDAEPILPIDVPGYAVVDVLGRGGMGVV